MMVPIENNDGHRFTDVPTGLESYWFWGFLQPPPGPLELGIYV